MNLLKSSPTYNFSNLCPSLDVVSALEFINWRHDFDAEVTITTWSRYHK